MLYDIESLEKEVARLLIDKDTLKAELEAMPKRHYRKDTVVEYWVKATEAYEAAVQKLEDAKRYNASEMAAVRGIDQSDPINLLANAYKLLDMVRDEFPDEDRCVIENVKQYLVDFCEGRVKRPKEIVEAEPEIISIKLKRTEFTCCNHTGKVSYTDRKYADGQRTELLRQYGKAKGVSTSVYRCKFCKLWHVGRKLEMVG